MRLTSRSHVNLRGNVGCQTKAPRSRTGFIARLQGYSFDIGNRLNSAPGKASYAYDGHGRRTALAYADGSSKVQVYGQAGKLLYSRHSAQGDTRHIYLGERLIAETNTIAGTSFSHTDALGSPVAKTSGAGALLSRTRYEPYGATAAGTNPTGIGFTGHVNDADTGLVYMQQRYQDPVAGRFLSVDPVVTNANSGKSFGRYHYANDNPYRYVDGDGRDAVGFLIKLLDNGGKVFLRKVDKAEAVAARKSGQNVQAATKSDAKQIEIAARDGNNEGILQHKGHKLEDGSVGDPHFQTEGVSGHTFWGSEMGGALPELLEALLVPIFATPSTLAPGTLYGPGTPYKNSAAYDKATKEWEEKRKQDEEKKSKPQEQK